MRLSKHKEIFRDKESTYSSRECDRSYHIPQRWTKTSKLCKLEQGLSKEGSTVAPLESSTLAAS